MTTLQALHQLLAQTPDSPARSRAGGTVEGMAIAYLPRWLSCDDVHPQETVPLLMRGEAAAAGDPKFAGWDNVTLDLSDPGTAHALFLGLALRYGLDPGLCGLRLSWRSTAAGYVLSDGVEWIRIGDHPDPTVRKGETLVVWPMDLETFLNPIAALEGAVAHTLGASNGS